ncbi:MAG: ribosomal RNA small subunit methyltransferase A [Candidatus Coatesbacteria bacterium]|nr:MAG: ribosomal RNA small subunit methyltransferase A [Candidatus Coatesbacteria bacterium]
MVRRAHKGQVFLVDNEYLRRVAETAQIAPTEVVLEIGMGRGELTQHLVRRAHEVVAVEVEERFVDAAARDFVSYDNLTVVHADILEVAWEDLVPARSPLVVVGNLPFYITGPILRLLTEHRAQILRWSLLLQREVAVRICASPGGREYGALSVKMQIWGEPYLAFVVPAEAFDPRPGVDAALVTYRYAEAPPVSWDSAGLFDNFVDFIFGARRKKIGNRVATLLGGALSAREIQARLEEVGGEAGARPERFSPAQFATLFQLLRPYLEADVQGV